MVRRLPPVAVALAALAGCAPAGSGVRVFGGGATFVDPAMQRWSGAYYRQTGHEIDYIKTGSGHGISNLTAGTIDFGCTDAPMSKKELAAAVAAGGEVLHVPLVVGSIAVVYNLPGVDRMRLSGPVLADVYLRNITKWNDPALAALNPGVPLPDRSIIPVSRADGSGTTNIFSEYLSKNSPEFQEKVGTTKLMVLPPGGTGQQGNDGVAGFVKNNPGSIGYVELAYAKRNDIPFAAVRNRAGAFVLPDAAGVTAAAEAALREKPAGEPYTLHDLTYSMTDTAGPAAYPIVGVSYAILYKKQPRDKGPVLADFLKWAVADGQPLAAELDYAPLPAELTTKARAKLGTVQFE